MKTVTEESQDDKADTRKQLTQDQKEVADMKLQLIALEAEADIRMKRSKEDQIKKKIQGTLCLEPSDSKGAEANGDPGWRVPSTGPTLRAPGGSPSQGENDLPGAQGLPNKAVHKRDSLPQMPRVRPHGGQWQRDPQILFLLGV